MAGIHPFPHCLCQGGDTWEQKRRPAGRKILGQTPRTEGVKVQHGTPKWDWMIWGTPLFGNTHLLGEVGCFSQTPPSKMWVFFGSTRCHAMQSSPLG